MVFEIRVSGCHLHSVVTSLTHSHEQISLTHEENRNRVLALSRLSLVKGSRNSPISKLSFLSHPLQLKISSCSITDFYSLCDLCRSKYEQQAFLKPSLRIQSGSAKQSLQASLSRKIVNSLRSSNSSENSEYIGTMKVKVLKGSNLAVRDMLSSDPYIVLTLGQQKVQTSVVNSYLNPVWNEELTLSIPHDYSQVKLQVYDHDTFSADDIMGEADIDIQPMITSALAYGDARKFADMQIGKWLKSYDNALIEDSPVNIVAGKVRQDLWLRLQNVESGEVELELEWVLL
ncbi:ADP-ribosylation factor GTPase-activating protein AGD12-like [Salvia miltiorrhiza]|uniref:ADP-ribosylation factor GTPase-activating protein AGD12-like n=1 Tax=Salvia miltiorrhiza TaxID=226208 RepID=UPI0025ACCC11|nr:ADP-ribosylation factor GTPase-activating protein AGD12-like [Salvia miltiorrhiza]